MRGFRKILVALHKSNDTLIKGIRMAQDEGAWITVVKVIPPYEGDLELVGVKNISDVLGSGAQAAIRQANETATSERALVKTRLEEGEADKKIVEVAREERCDLIIMEKDNSNFLMRLLGGNITGKVIKNAPCPVLVVGCA